MTNNDLLHQSITLKDGRKLGYAEVGDKNGIPVLHFHGHPGSRLEAVLFEKKFAKNNLHLVAVDRPGFGLSEYQVKRKLLDWPKDVIELVDYLGWENFFIRGYSAGGPYALACAYKFPERIYNCQLIAGVAPIEIRKPFMSSKMKFLIFLGRLIPSLIRNVEKAEFEKFKDHDQAREWLVKMIKGLGVKDQNILNNNEMMNFYISDCMEALRAGIDGMVQDTLIMIRPWGFKIQEIPSKVPVHIWHGELDKNVPFFHGIEMGKVIQNSVTHFQPEDGHFSIMFDYIDETIENIKKYIP